MTVFNNVQALCVNLILYIEYYNRKQRTDWRDSMRNKKSLLLIISVLLIAIAGLLYFFKLNDHTSFENIVLNDKEEITQIDIIRSSDNAIETLESANKLEQVLTVLSDIRKIKETNDDYPNINELYWITIKENGQRQYGVPLMLGKEDDFVSIFNYDGGDSSNYKILESNKLKLIDNFFEE